MIYSYKYIYAILSINFDISNIIINNNLKIDHFYKIVQLQYMLQRFIHPISLSSNDNSSNSLYFL